MFSTAFRLFFSNLHALIVLAVLPPVLSGFASLLLLFSCMLLAFLCSSAADASSAFFHWDGHDFRRVVNVVWMFLEAFVAFSCLQLM